MDSSMLAGMGLGGLEDASTHDASMALGGMDHDHDDGAMGLLDAVDEADDDDDGMGGFDGHGCVPRP